MSTPADVIRPALAAAAFGATSGAIRLGDYPGHPDL